MGRGRAKAKQTKVARALKYHSPDTDLAALQRELGGRARGPGDSVDPSDTDQYDEYADEVDDDDGDSDDDEDETDDGRWARRG
jgi:hypothetical protein